MPDVARRTSLAEDLLDRLRASQAVADDSVGDEPFEDFIIGRAALRTKDGSFVGEISGIMANRPQGAGWEGPFEQAPKGTLAPAKAIGAPASAQPSAEERALYDRFMEHMNPMASYQGEALQTPPPKRHLRWNVPMVPVAEADRIGQLSCWQMARQEAPVQEPVTLAPAVSVAAAATLDLAPAAMVEDIQTPKLLAPMQSRACGATEPRQALQLGKCNLHSPGVPPSVLEDVDMGETLTLRPRVQADEGQRTPSLMQNTSAPPVQKRHAWGGSSNVVQGQLGFPNWMAVVGHLAADDCPYRNAF
ncbi:unnamed protein product [Ostreobium quekettii]|uniref:Uncharacterized protein n=1 Tax=Ostreobium quekettii TaxID=121088 RepID=A0A8S1IMW7_9CHLO|nr:unnamed protein product [Ostreobium quekettii]